MINNTILEDVSRKYGPPTQYDSKGTLVFNEQSFAELYSRHYPLVYLPAEKRFYHYVENTGLWESANTEKLLYRLGIFLHEYAETRSESLVERKRTPSALRNILTFLSEAVAQKSFFSLPDHMFIHCANGVLELDECGNWILDEFSPEYHSRNRCEIAFNSSTACPRFLNELLRCLVEEEDMELLQQYLGQCLLGINITQTLLLLTGSGGSGKGTLSRIIEFIVGKNNYTQIRPEHIAGRFETGFFRGKTLLTGKESTTSFFTAKGMSVIKSLVGDDDIRVEEKASSESENIRGIFNLIVVGNSIPCFEFESDEEKSAWDRRIRWIRCKNYKPEKPIPGFAEKLLLEEGSGIFNWALEGTKKLLLSEAAMPCNKLQKTRIDYLLDSSNSMDLFLVTYVEPNRGTTITSDEMFVAFTKFVQILDSPSLSQRKFQSQIAKAMLKHFQTPLRRDVPRPRASDGKMTNRAGFYHVHFKGN